MNQPAHPIAAVTHLDPYPYYRELVRQQPMYRDAELGLWVASSAEAVTAVLRSPHCRVRPPKEPVPEALVDTPVGDLFRLLVRQNDGERHDRPKQAVSTALESLQRPALGRLAAECAGDLATELRLPDHAERLLDFALRMPVSVIGRLLGVPKAGLSHLGELVAKLVPGFAPTSTPGQAAGAQFAVRDTLELMGGILRDAEHAPRDGAWPALVRAGADAKMNDPAVLLANGVGLLTQSYEATAGLIGNTLLALARQPNLAVSAGKDAALLERIVREVARHDAPVQNTRRFAAEPVAIAGQQIDRGDTVLVLLAAANRDPTANPEPDRLDPERRERRTFTFGLGAHACPGETIAVTIAAAGVAEVLRCGLDLQALAVTPRYRPSTNGRIPLLGQPS